jgi:hypothetical protein
VTPSKPVFKRNKTGRSHKYDPWFASHAHALRKRHNEATTPPLTPSVPPNNEDSLLDALIEQYTGGGSISLEIETENLLGWLEDVE